MIRALLLALLLAVPTSLHAGNLLRVQVSGYPTMLVLYPDGWKDVEIFWEWSPSATGPWNRVELASPYENSPAIDRNSQTIYLRLRVRPITPAPGAARSTHAKPYLLNEY